MKKLLSHLLPTILISVLTVSCVTSKLVVIPSNKVITSVVKNTNFVVNPANTNQYVVDRNLVDHAYIVPVDRMLEIEDQLSKCLLNTNKTAAQK